MNPILNAIAELESNGLATRSWADAGRCLALCGRCDRWTGCGCVEHAKEPGPFAGLLCDVAFVCERWAS